MLGIMSIDFRKKVGLRIRRERLYQKKSQVELSGLAGISQDNLSKIERGLQEPSLGTLLKIADALHLKLYDLIKDVD